MNGVNEGSENMLHTVTPTKFRELMSTLASSVVVVATRTSDRCPIGLTVSSITSLSLSPPRLLVCLEREKFTVQAIRQSGIFSVNILSNAQREIAVAFASAKRDKFENIEWKTGRTVGAPLIDGSLTHVECKLATMIPSGDHVIVIGDICGGSTSDGLPLVYSSRKYLKWANEFQVGSASEDLCGMGRLKAEPGAAVSGAR